MTRLGRGERSKTDLYLEYRRSMRELGDGDWIEYFNNFIGDPPSGGYFV